MEIAWTQFDRISELIHFSFVSFKFCHRKSRHASVRRRPGDNVIVARYIGTGNLLGNITKGIFDSFQRELGGGGH